MIKLYKSICKNYRNGNYMKVISLMDKYLNIKGVGLDPEIITCYARSLYEIGDEEESKNIMKNYKVFHDNAISKVELALEHIKRCEYDKARPLLEQVLKNYPYYDSLYYELCLIECRTGNIKKAREYFEKLTEFNKNPIFVSNIQKLVEYYETGKIDNLLYSFFDGLDFLLKPGHIVRLKQGVCDSLDLYKSKPVLIYKVEDEIVYAFKISFQIRPQHYIIQRINSDNEQGQLCPDIIKFKKDGVLKICSELSEKEFEDSLVDLYYRYIRFWKDKDLNDDVFVNGMQKMLKKS